MYQIDFNHPSSIYFVGIGGISMSGLAEILADAGFRVSGSDRSKSPLTETLERKGITVFYGNVPRILLMISTASYLPVRSIRIIPNISPRWKKASRI